jgi:hypothetical protein
MIAGAKKSKAGCARRRLGESLKDSGSNPDISKVVQFFRNPELRWGSLLQNAPTAQPLGAFFMSGPADLAPGPNIIVELLGIVEDPVHPDTPDPPQCPDPPQ